MWEVVLLLLLLWLFLFRTREEGFTVALRDGVLCQPYLHSSPPSGTVVLIIEGYNYQEPPKVYRDGNPLLPLQSEWDYQSMAYYYMLDAPQGWEGSEWVLETTDRISPLVHRVNPQEKGGRVKASLIRVRDGAYRWLLE